MLTTFKGGGPVSVGSRNAGRIVLWDITDLSSIKQQWAFPEEGYIAAPHKAQRIELDGQDLLLYAHSMGASDSFDGVDAGSIGLAQFALEEPPVYLGDWFAFRTKAIGFRDVELLPDGETLLLADSGCESLNMSCMDVGGISTVAAPEIPSASGQTGPFSRIRQQVFRDLNHCDWIL